MIDPYERVVVGRYSDGRAMVVNRRTKEMLELTEHQTGIDTIITQGSYNTSVSASGGTHAGGGVVDLRVTQYTDAERNKLLAGLRAVGFIAWFRTPSQGDWPYHIHIVAKGDADLSDAAKAQVAQANAGTNGLANHAPDTSNLNVPTFDWTEYITMLTDIINRVAAVESKITADNPLGRAQYAYKSVTEGGALENRVTVVEGQVGPTTDARAQYAYTSVLDGGALENRVSTVEGQASATAAEVGFLDARVAALEAAPKA